MANEGCVALPPSLSDRERKARLRSLLVGYQWEDERKARIRRDTERTRVRKLATRKDAGLSSPPAL